jgi:hypothetical protein
MDNIPCFKFIYSLGYVSTNILQKKNESKLCLFMVWYEPTNPRVTTTAMEVDKQINGSQVTSKATWH